MAKKLKPIHPGEQLHQEFMIPLELSSNALARALDVTPTRINEIVRGRRGISADTALRLARFFGTSHQFWLNLQANYEYTSAVSMQSKPAATNASSKENEVLSSTVQPKTFPPKTSGAISKPESPNLRFCTFTLSLSVVADSRSVYRVCAFGAVTLS
jgi:antitoxin HigA-1